MKRKSWGIYIGILGMVLMISFIARSLASGPSTAPQKKDIVKAQRTSTAAGKADERMVIPGPGLVAGNAIVEPRQPSTKVASAVPGRIAAIAVHEGDRVKRGALLVQLEDGPEQAAFQVALHDYEKAMHGQRKEDIEASISDAEAARARADLSAEALRRTEQAEKGGAATADELDRARRQAESDRRTFDASESRSRAMVAGSRYEDIAAARARRDQAKANLERLAVRAPIDGEVLQVKYRAGEYVTPGGDPLVMMGDMSALRVRIDVDERDIGHIAVGDSAFAVADAYPGKKFTGSVVEVGRMMGRKNARTDDPTERIDTKILETVIELDNANGLVPGQLVTGYIRGSK
jgi:HlyD family secretion protein